MITRVFNVIAFHGDATIFPAGRENLGQCLDMLDGLIVHHRPVRPEFRAVIPMDWSLGAQFAHRLLPAVFRPQVSAREVERINASGLQVTGGNVCHGVFSHSFEFSA